VFLVGAAVQAGALPIPVRYGYFAAWRDDGTLQQLHDRSFGTGGVICWRAGNGIELALAPRRP
jgi:hypothetical protein